MYDAARDSDPLLARRGRSTTRSTFTLAHVLLACGAACACAVFATVTILQASTGDARGLARVGDVDASDAYALGGMFNVKTTSKKLAKRAKRVKKDATTAIDEKRDSVEVRLAKTRKTLEDVKADLEECKARMDANDDDAALGGFKKTYSKAKNAVTDAVSDAKDVKEKLKEVASALKECKAKLDEKKADDAAALGGFFKKAKKASRKAKKTASKVKDAAVDVKDAVMDAASDAASDAKDVKARLEQAAKDLKECTAQLADKDYSADY
jgi:vacuolar-type H+-ATPase subunit I/STV1